MNARKQRRLDRAAEARREKDVRHLSAHSVAELATVLATLPPDARVYTTDQGYVEVWKGKQRFAEILLTGF